MCERGEENLARNYCASIFTIVSGQIFFSSLTHLLRDTTSGSHADSRLPNLLPAMPGTHLSRDPIPIRQHVHRQSTSLPGLRREDPPAAGVRNGVPGLLTRIADMSLLDLREPPEESDVRSKREPGTRRVRPPRRVTHSRQTHGSPNVKTR